MDLGSGTRTAGPFTGHTDAVRMAAVVAFDGRPVVVTVGHNGALKVLDLTPDRSTTTSAEDREGGSVRHLAVTTMGDRPAVIIAGDDGTVKIWDVATGNALGELPTEQEAWLCSRSMTSGKLPR
ncbi:hypothetical protein [Nonomuraea sp. NPDC050643]|uniref:hypothetical protein n=1 Tax=Nonomuraea sp. NPDC050643 TaxID=3155660 RepID=UPI0033FACE4B